MPRLSALLLFHVFSINIFAQQKDTGYKSDANELQQEIWFHVSAPFHVSEIPASMNSESAVIIARSFEVKSSTDTRLLFRLQTAPVILNRSIWHERIKINDKAALEKYSSREYMKELDRTYSYRYVKIHDTIKTYFGAKVIKQDGTETIVNSNEEVLTKNEKNEKTGKIVISGLQTGDILDYYLVFEDIQEARGNIKGPYTFFLGGEYPILYYYARFQLAYDNGVEYINANGAPALKQSYNENGDIILGLALRNIPKIDDSLFTSPLRQYPYIRLQYKYVTKEEERYTHFKRGVVKHESMANDLLEQFKRTYSAQLAGLNSDRATTLKNYFGETIKTKQLSSDDIIKALFDDYRYTTFCQFSTDDIDFSNDINYRYANNIDNAIFLSKVLTALRISNTIYLVCSRYSNSLNNVMNISDFGALLKIPGAKQYWISFDDIVTRLNEIPARFQGEDAITIEPAIGSLGYTIKQDKVPVTSASDNTISENISVHLDTSDMQLLQVDRICRQTGALRHDDQKRLLLMEDMEAALAKPLTQKNQLERLNYSKNNNEVVNEYLTAFTKERNNSRTYFTGEINDHYNAAPKDITTYEIHEPALYGSTDSFEYSEAFTIENFVKKAGNNFIIEAGRLIGFYKKIDDKERIRRNDAYLPCAGTYNWDIVINIPENYTVKGFEDFNKKITNKTGSFNCMAQKENGKVEINIALVYYHNFEPAANWNSLLELMDAVYSISMQKLLLEKNKL